MKFRPKTFLRLFRPTWYLDALLFWAVFSGSTIFILWLFNNTTKKEMREAMEQRVLSTTRSAAVLLDPKIHFGVDETVSLAAYFRKVHPAIDALRHENPDVEDIWLTNVSKLEKGTPLRTAILQAQENGWPVLSDWKFLTDEVFFFFTPQTTGQEFGFISIPGWEQLPQDECPVAVITFNAAKMRGELATVDANSANVIAIAILLATALSLMARRRSIQREEAVEQKLAAMRLLHQRDRILAAAVAAADRFITDRNLSAPIHHLLSETKLVVQAEAAYFLTLRRFDYPSLPAKQNKPSGVLPDGRKAFDVSLLQKPEWQRWRTELDAGRSMAENFRTLPGKEHTLLQQLGLRSLAILPVVTQGRLAAVLVLEHSVEDIEWEPGLITTLKLTANLLGSAIARRENEARLQQASKMEALGKMAGGVAHEFNNLLHIITGNLSSLSSKLSEEQGGLVQKITQASQRGTKIIDQLLHATRPPDTADFQPVSINDVVEHTIALFQPALGKSIELEVKLTPNLPPAPMDENLIQQVLLNILLNAQHAVGEKGKILVQTGQTGRRTIFCSVRDSGPGIPQKIMGSIFDPFFTTRPPGIGTGLGLFTSRGILEQHNGFLEAVNHPESGALFTFYLPIRKVSTEAPSKETPVETEKGGLPTDQMFLLADDEPLCLELACDVLREHGFHFLTATNGDELLEKAREHRDEIDWVITDWTMPGPSGPELVQQLRQILQEGKKEKNRLIVTSGFLIEGDHPIDALLRKPFQPEELLKLITKLACS